METFLNDSELPEALLVSKSNSVIADVELNWCAPEEVPEPYHGLLVHESDMTSALERFHDDAIVLKVLQARENEGHYFREVVLQAAESHDSVEYGLIEIELKAFKPGLRAAIVEGGQPLGGLLNETGLQYRSAPQGFFRVSGEKLTSIFSSSSSGKVLFGRYNQLLTEENTLLARIIEILPTAPNHDQ